MSLYDNKFTYQISPGVLNLGMDHYFFIRGVYHFWDLQTIFFRVIRFKQFFSLHFVMKTIFLQPFKKNVTGFL